jgi:hypothetical protein
MKITKRILVPAVILIVFGAVVHFILHLIYPFTYVPEQEYPFDKLKESDRKRVETENGITIGIVLHQMDSNYELSYEASLPTILRHMKAQDTLLVLDYASEPALKFQSPWVNDARVKIIRKEFEISLDPLADMKKSNLYNFWVGIHHLLTHTTTFRFCHFNNDMLVNPSFEFRSLLFDPAQTMFPTNEQFFTPNVCAESKQWKELSKLFPLEITSSSALDSSSGDQIIRWIFGTKIIGISRSMLTHIPHQGSTYHRRYDYHQFTLARLFILINHKFGWLVETLQSYNPPSAHIQNDYYRTEFFFCERTSRCFYLLEPILYLASFKPIYMLVDLTLQNYWIWSLQIFLLYNDWPLFLVALSFAVQLFFVLYLISLLLKRRIPSTASPRTYII